MEEATHKPRYPWYVRVVVGRNPLYTLFRAIVWATLLVVLFKFVLLGVRVHGQSMEPTFREGQVKFVNRVAYLRRAPKRGDIVAIKAPELNAVIVKRVIGLPGETVSIHRGGDVYIDGKRLEEPYAKGRTSFQGQQQLEPNQYFLIGDNRDVSEKYFIYDYKIVGKVIL
jgi:signal peptidase I